mgnify:CR=1 FL=1
MQKPGPTYQSANYQFEVTVNHAEKIETREHRAVSVDLIIEIQQFLYREARLLDGEYLHEWLELLADDIHYWIPGVQTRYRNDDAKFSPTRMAFFDDDLEYLKIRVARAKQPSTEWTVHSLVINNRHHAEDDEMELKARRVDLIRRDTDGSLKLARRKVILQQTVLQAKNINTFL